MSREIINVHDWVDEQGILRRTVRYTDSEEDVRFADYVKSVVDRAPELTDSQVAELRSVMGPLTRPAGPSDKARVPRPVSDGPKLRTEELVIGQAVYFMQAGSEVGEIKIGYSNNPEGRLQLLQTGNPYPLKILATIPGAGKAEERRLHRMFETDRLMGEWFRPSAALLAYIRDIPGSGS